MRSREVIARHSAAGRFFEAAGIRSFVRERGEGQAVVCIHGPLRSCIARCWLSSPLEA